MKKRRIFIAVNLPEDIKRKISDYQRELQQLPARWVKPANLHITLVFLGYISDEELLEVSQITKEVAKKHSSFSVELDKTCYAPARKIPPKMIWLLVKKSERLSRLQKDLAENLGTKEERGYSPHITLARIRQWEWRRIEPEERPEIEKEFSLTFPVFSIEIMESELKKSGAEYTILESIQLGE